MSNPPSRAAMVPVATRVRAYFAPVLRGQETPTIFDPESWALSNSILRRHRGLIWDGWIISRGSA